MTRTQAVVTALGLFGVWMLATYLLEARMGTFVRPDTVNRFVYTVVAQHSRRHRRHRTPRARVQGKMGARRAN